MVSPEETCSGDGALRGFAGLALFSWSVLNKSVPECPGNAKALRSYPDVLLLLV